MSTSEQPADPGPALGFYEGQPIIAAGVTINNASGGLHDAVAIDPVRLDVGDTVHVILRCIVRPPQFDPVDKDNVRGPLKLVNRLHAEDATFVDAEMVGPLIDAQRERIDAAKEAEKRQAEEDERQLKLETGGGEPQPIGAVLDDALAMADDAASDADWRAARAAELEPMSRDQLVEIADGLGIATAKLTKGELRDEIVAREAEERDGD